MIAGVTHDTGSTGGRPCLSAVSPLNEQRRNDALYLLACEYGQRITPYDICKTQVLADVLQVIETGKVIFGGRLFALPFGPVESLTLRDCKRWAMAYFFAATRAVQMSFDDMPLRPASWRQGTREPIPEFVASPDYGRQADASWEWFSVSEHANIHSAYDHVTRMTWTESQRFFHKPVSAIGYAYEVATRNYPEPLKTRVEMNWFDVLDGAEKVEYKDVSYARAMLGLWA